MFIGHFAAGFAAKKVIPKTSLGVTIMASVFLDLLWPIFGVLGIEKAAINHSIGTYNHLDLISAEWSHSLGISIIWSVLFGVLSGFYYKSKKVGLVLGLVVFSHWIFDWITHIPDLPLWFSGAKVGLGVWKSAPLSFALEFSMFATSVWLYLKVVPKFVGKDLKSFMGLIFLMVASYISSFLMPPPPESISSVQLSAAGFGFWIAVIWCHQVEASFRKIS